MSEKTKLELETEVKKYKLSKCLGGLIPTVLLCIFIAIGIIAAVRGEIDIGLAIFYWILPIIVICTVWVNLAKYFICRYKIIRKSCTGKHTMYNNRDDNNYYLEFGEEDIKVKQKLYEAANNGDIYYLLATDERSDNKLCKVYSVSEYSYKEI